MSNLKIAENKAKMQSNVTQLSLEGVKTQRIEQEVYLGSVFDMEADPMRDLERRMEGRGRARRSD